MRTPRVVPCAPGPTVEERMALDVEGMRRAVAERAAALVEPGMTVGLGTGRAAGARADAARAGWRAGAHRRWQPDPGLPLPDRDRSRDVGRGGEGHHRRRRAWPLPGYGGHGAGRHAVRGRGAAPPSLRADRWG